jgi:hypothetical protein
MADDDTQPATPAQQPADADRANGRPGVSIPAWMAAALVVVLGLAIGGAGFALGRSTADDGVQQIQPIGAQTPNEQGERPLPPGVEGRRGPGGPGGERGECRPGGPHERGEDAEQGEDQDNQQGDGSQQQEQDQGEGF